MCYTSLEQQYTGSRTQAAIALSSAEPELYAVATAAQESLCLSNFIKEAFEVRINIRMHTDSSAAESIAMREGTSKKAKLFIQQLKSKLTTMHKVKPEEPSRHSHQVCWLWYTQQTHVCSWPLRPPQPVSHSVRSKLNNSCAARVCMFHNYISAAGLVTCFRVYLAMDRPSLLQLLRLPFTCFGTIFCVRDCACFRQWFDLHFR